MSVTILRSTDRIKIKVGELVFVLAPLTYAQKSEIKGIGSKIIHGEEVTNGMMVYYKSIQLSLKDIEGLVDIDGKKYELTFDDEGVESDCMDDLFNMEFNEKLMMCAYNMVDQIPKEIIDPSTGKILEGVEIVKGKH